MIHASLTTDFECLSPSVDGSSPVDISSQMVVPATNLATIADRHGHKITFFLEVIQWHRFNIELANDFDVIELNHLIKHLHANGHDIQIHAHSEWVTAKFNKGKWYRAWKGRDSVHQILDEFTVVFLDALAGLKGLLGQRFTPVCYRAGGYNVDPVKPLFPFLLSHGFISDSSRHAKTPMGAHFEEGLVSLPILGTYPTSSQRWDMNLSIETPFYIFNNSSPREDDDKFAVMMGHTKMFHDWNILNRCFQLLSDDDFITVVPMKEQAIFARNLLNNSYAI